MFPIIFAKYKYPLGDVRLRWLHDVKSMFMKDTLSLRICRVHVNLAGGGYSCAGRHRGGHRRRRCPKRGDRKIMMPTVHSCCNGSGVIKRKGRKCPLLCSARQMG
ncbi:hypothetical protein CEXT_110721 [Caerostris extrusa]|uniref:Uncharacterized protein n=1 Tax=Caerostris extrusa TaxID=172846 RepID=A0AAV4XZY2_CAEEX|nr:hypothetical protein CEXT_110721 [Caerostris extrusa]